MKTAKYLLLGAVAVMVSTTAIARDDDTIEYRVVEGDSLYKLAEAYFTKLGFYTGVQKLNSIREPRLLQPDRVIAIPREYLKYDPVDVRVQAFSGPVTISGASGDGRPSIGMVLREGAVVSTGRRGFISLAGHGNSRVSLPSNSRVRVKGARRYLIDGSVDFEIEVLQGRSEIIAPKLKNNERYRVGTPVAATAVRGTRFRVSFDPEGSVAATEVTEGVVGVSADEATVATEAGFGISAMESGLGELEELLPSPELVDATKIQTGEELSFTIVPIEEAMAYRTQLARDAGFVEVVSETIEAGTQAEFSEIEDGRYFVRSRGIAESGLEGFSEAYSFRRKRVGVSAAVETSPLVDAFKFAWLSEGSGRSYFAFQLWPEGDAQNLLFDEVGMDQQDILISELPPGNYAWRVGTFQIDEGDVIKVWAEPQILNIGE